MKNTFKPIVTLIGHLKMSVSQVAFNHIYLQAKKSNDRLTCNLGSISTYMY